MASFFYVYILQSEIVAFANEAWARNFERSLKSVSRRAVVRKICRVLLIGSGSFAKPRWLAFAPHRHGESESSEEAMNPSGGIGSATGELLTGAPIPPLQSFLGGKSRTAIPDFFTLGFFLLAI